MLPASRSDLTAMTASDAAASRPLRRPLLQPPGTGRRRRRRTKWGDSRVGRREADDPPLLDVDHVAAIALVPLHHDGEVHLGGDAAKKEKGKGGNKRRHARTKGTRQRNKPVPHPEMLEEFLAGVKLPAGERLGIPGPADHAGLEDVVRLRQPIVRVGVDHPEHLALARHRLQVPHLRLDREEGEQLSLVRLGDEEVLQRVGEEGEQREGEGEDGHRGRRGRVVDRQQGHQHEGNVTQSNHGATAESDELLPAAAARKAFIGFRNSKARFIGRPSRPDQPSTLISVLGNANS